MRARNSLFIIIAAGISLFTAQGFATSAFPSDFTVEGRLFKADDTPVDDNNVAVMLEVFDESNATCVLYREVHSGLNLYSQTPSAIGTFAVRLGTGTARYSNLPLATIFSSSTLTGEGSCSFTTNSSKHRFVRVKVWDSSGGSWSPISNDTDPKWDTLTPDTMITASPMATVADSLQGHGAGDFILGNTNSALSQNNVESVFTVPNFANLMNLLSGNLGNQRLTNVNTPIAGDDAVNKDYADTNIAGKSFNTGGSLANGQVLTWNATAAQWEAATPASGITGLQGDVVTSGSGNILTATIQNDVVTSQMIKDDAIVSAKISSGSIAKNRLLMSDAMTGASASFITCAPSEVLQADPNGFACVTVPAMLGMSGVTAGSYGSSMQVPQITLDAQGRVIAAANVSINFPVISVAGHTGAVSLTPADIPGLGSASLTNVGTGPNDTVQLDASARLPAVDGGLLTNVNATRLAGRAVSTIFPTAMQVLTFNSSTGEWFPASQNTLGTFTNGGNTFASGAATLGTSDANALRFMTGGSVQAEISSAGNMGLGLLGPTARLQIAAGTGTAGTAPLKFTTGTNLTVPEAGAVEYDGAYLYLTDSTNTRRSLAYAGAPVSTQGAPGSMTFTSDSDSTGDGGFSFKNGSTNVLTIDNAGNSTFAGNIAQTGSSGFSTGTGAVALNGLTTLAAGKNFVMQPGAGTFTQTYTGGSGTPFQINSTSLTGGSVFQISSSSNPTSPLYGAAINMSGNGSSGGQQAGIYSSVTGVSGTSNIGGIFKASGSSVGNFSLLAQGAASVSTMQVNPGRLLDVTSDNDASVYMAIGASVASPARFSTSTQSAAIRVSNTSGGAGTGAFLELQSKGTTGNLQNAYVAAISENASYSPSLVFGRQTGATSYKESMRIAADGTIGIGTANPGAALDVAGQLRVGQASAIDPGTDSMVIGARPNNNAISSLRLSPMNDMGRGWKVDANDDGSTTYFQIWDQFAGAPRLRINGSGNVGIGTTNPVATLDINGTSGSTLRIVDGNQGLGKVLTSGVNGIATWRSRSTSGPVNLYVNYSSGNDSLCDGSSSTYGTPPACPFKTLKAAVDSLPEQIDDNVMINLSVETHSLAGPVVIGKRGHFSKGLLTIKGSGGTAVLNGSPGVSGITVLASAKNVYFQDITFQNFTKGTPTGFDEGVALRIEGGIAALNGVTFMNNYKAIQIKGGSATFTSPSGGITLSNDMNALGVDVAGGGELHVDGGASVNMNAISMGQNLIRVENGSASVEGILNLYLSSCSSQCAGLSIESGSSASVYSTGNLSISDVNGNNVGVHVVGGRLSTQDGAILGFTNINSGTALAVEDGGRVSLQGNNATFNVNGGTPVTLRGQSSMVIGGGINFTGSGIQPPIFADSQSQIRLERVNGGASNWQFSSFSPYAIRLNNQSLLRISSQNAPGLIVNPSILVSANGGSRVEIRDDMASCLNPGSTRSIVIDGTSFADLDPDCVNRFPIQAAQISLPGTTFDFAQSSIITTTNSCGAFTLNNLREGRSYTLVVEGTSLGSCSFTSYKDNGMTSLTVHLPTSIQTVNGNRIMYNFTVIGTDVYVSGQSGL